MSKKNIIIIAASILLLIVVFTLPITVPMSIETPCKISPANKWFVELGTDGNVLTTLKNAKTGSVENYFSAVPERGDSYAFKLVNSITNNWVEKGDTVGLIHSNLLSQEYAALNGRLETSKSNLEVLMTGEKKSLIQYAREQLNAAIEHAQYTKNIYEIKNELFKKNLISFEENELYRSQTKQAEIDVAVKRAYLASIETGGKQEQINLIKNQIKSIEQQLKVLDEKKQSYTIVTPISGIVNAYNSADTILTVSSPNSILFIPVAWRYRILLDIGSQVDLTLSGTPEVSYTISKIANDIQQFNGEQVLTLIATSEHSALGLPDNLWTTCTLHLGEVSLFEFLKWKLSQTYEV